MRYILITLISLMMKIPFELFELFVVSKHLAPSHKHSGDLSVASKHE